MMTVLLMEDDPVLRGLQADSLREQGFDVAEAPDGRTAMALLAAKPQIRILLADRGLGGKSSEPNGFQLAAQALEHYPNLRVIYTTGTHMALKSRPLSPRERILYKPFTASQLMNLIRQLA